MIHLLRTNSTIYALDTPNQILPQFTPYACIHYQCFFAMEAVKRFFSSPRFAVAGASNDANKFGYKRRHIKIEASTLHR